MANERARALRKVMTPQEAKLWNRLRELRPLGHHFRRQVPLGGYIVDFACLRSKLVIEVDGDQHGRPDGRLRDAARDAALAAAGFRVLRVWNFEVNDTLDGVLERITAECGTGADHEHA